MPHPLSTLGAIHTALSLVPLVAGAHGLIRDRRIDPATGFHLQAQLNAAVAPARRPA